MQRYKYRPIETGLRCQHSGQSSEIQHGRPELQAGDKLEMLIVSDQQCAVLETLGRDPHVVQRDWRTSASRCQPPSIGPDRSQMPERLPAATTFGWLSIDTTDDRSIDAAGTLRGGASA
jgi:hypothetical protein